MPYHLAAARLYFNLFGSLLIIPNTIDRRAYVRFAEAAKLSKAHSLLDLGAGQGYLASRLISARGQRPGALTLLEISEVNVWTMKLRFRARRNIVRILRVGLPPFPLPVASFDRFVACFVLELLDESHQRRMVDEAYRLLRFGGQICCMAMVAYRGRASRFISRALSLAYRHTPWLAQGALQGSLKPLFSDGRWLILKLDTILVNGFCTEILIAEKVQA